MTLTAQKRDSWTMIQRHLIPLGAGLVSAVTFISVALGHPGLGMVLFLIVPLPILLAGLAQGWMPALLSGSAASLIILLAAGPSTAAAFAIAQAAPAVALSYLALLSRPGANEDAAEWYPAGRLVIACALIGALLSLAFVLALGGTHEALKEKIAPIAEATIKAQLKDVPGSSPIADEDIPKLVDAAVTLMPAMTAVTAMSVLLFNLWLAGRVTLASGQLARPWPDLGLLEFPRGTPLALAATTGAGFLDGFPGMAGSAFSGTLFLAYVLLGLAIAHYTTRGAGWRSYALWALYLSLLLINPTVLIVALAGLADSIWPLRRAPPS